SHQNDFAIKIITNHFGPRKLVNDDERQNRPTAEGWKGKLTFQSEEVHNRRKEAVLSSLICSRIRFKDIQNHPSLPMNGPPCHSRSYEGEPETTMKTPLYVVATPLAGLALALMLATPVQAAGSADFALNFNESSNYVAVPHTAALNSFPLTV